MAEENTSECTECYHLKSSILLMAHHLERVAQELDDESIKQMLAALLKARRIFVLGAGRSGLVGRAFAMRLMHLGLSSHVVGETTTPAVSTEDAVVAISGSGQTRSVSDLGKVAKDIGATVIAITSNKDSKLGNLADVAVVLPGRTKDDVGGYLERHMRGEYTYLTPLGTSFETSASVFLDAVIAELIYITGASEADLKSRHTNIE
ncbi:MAG: 6-phospho-3-hexuloisomerase [Methanolobus sp.]|uniref:6-phospho-3-hexuloisomerase n=1 Tax=Methanolobus sp. TaxID=1874737 RepID=UPI00028BA716|nr:6-phospho-3-hexuloisomerase [Methanolobus sp.]AFV23832.1 hexulose-6-phosphate isomerase [Methanolobus psychrophilus R15]MDP2218410.1 6-phospho-3-hexuloisomerase [Methanolobus sp.]